jgi:hypothetical protein
VLFDEKKTESVPLNIFYVHMFARRPGPVSWTWPR